MNWSDVLKAVIPVIAASLAWLLGPGVAAMFVKKLPGI
jgi:hypothetical protein